MQLKKLNKNLQKSLEERGYVSPTELQLSVYSTIKSGADCVVSAPKGSGKSTSLALHIIQKLESAQGESTRALILVNAKEEALQTLERLRDLAKYTDLRFYATHDRSDIDYDKNQLSLGNDVLIGTPTRLNAMFSSAGFNLSTVRFFAVDDADAMFKLRHDAIVLRLSASVFKTQYLFMCLEITERVAAVADKIMTEPFFFDVEDTQFDQDDAREEE